MDGSQKEGGNFLNLLLKEGSSLRKSGGGGGGGPTLEETMILIHNKKLCYQWIIVLYVSVLKYTLGRRLGTGFTDL